MQRVQRRRGPSGSQWRPEGAPATREDGGEALASCEKGGEDHVAREEGGEAKASINLNKRRGNTCEAELSEEWREHRRFSEL
jgi:hypothetical protein